MNDANDNAPVFTADPYNVSVFENQAPNTYVGTVTATDADIGSNANVTYALSRPSEYFTINPLTGVINSLVTFDREVTNKYSLVVKASDGVPSHTVTTHVDIHILDTNDHAPVFVQKVYEASVNFNSFQGTPIIWVSATDADIGNNSIVYYKLGPNPLSKYITITKDGYVEVLLSPIDPQKTLNYNIPVIAYDAVNASMNDTATLSLTITGIVLAQPTVAGQSSGGGKQSNKLLLFFVKFYTSVSSALL